MKGKLKIALLVIVLLLSIGYAAVNTSLFLNGSLAFGINDDFDVRFTKSVVDGEDLSDTIISADGRTITFTVEGLTTIGETTILNYVVTNNSSQYDAEVEITCTAQGDNAASFNVSKTVPTSLKAQTIANGEITASLENTSSASTSEIYSCTLDAVPVERTEEANESAIKLVSGTGENVGDEIAIGDQGFYVISNDGKNIRMIAKMNIDFTTNYQSNSAGTTAYSSDTQKGTNYSSYSGSVVEGYVNNYIDYLNDKYGLNITGDIITVEELSSLKCDFTNETCINSPYSWIYSTSYWTQHIDTETNTYVVNSDGSYEVYYYIVNNTHGVRPVITISVDDFNAASRTEGESINLLENSTVWTSLYGGNWGGANGTITSPSTSTFTMDMNSVGNVGEWGAQAILKNASILLENPKDYTLSATIKSDVTRQVLLKMLNYDSTGNNGDGAYVMIEQWISLTANEEYNLNIDFTPYMDHSSINIYFGLGGTDAAISNLFEVTNLKIVEKNIDYTKLNYLPIGVGSATLENYYYGDVRGLIAEVLAHNYPADETITSLYFPVAFAPVEKVTVNRTEVEFNTNGGSLAYIPTEYFSEGYNEVIFYSATQFIAKVYLKKPAEPKLITDQDVDRIIDVGDEVAIASQEYYVLALEENNIKLLPKMNVDYTTDLQTTSAPTTIYSTTGPNYSGSIIEGYVNNYTNYINSTYLVNAIGSLVTLADLEKIAEKNFSTGPLSSWAPTWLYDSNYWVDAVSGETTGVILSSAKVFSYVSYSSNSWGFRPVITIPYSTVKENLNGEVVLPKVCEGDVCWVDADIDTTKNIGDMVFIGNQEFYILSNDGQNMELLSKLNVDPTSNLQSSSAANVEFGTTQDYSGSMVESYTNAYSSYIVSTYGIENTGTIITKGQLVSLGCSDTSCTNSSYSWLHNTEYWTQTEHDSASMVNYTVRSGGTISGCGVNTGTLVGVRPIIIISSSVLEF